MPPRAKVNCFPNPSLNPPLHAKSVRPNPAKIASALVHCRESWEKLDNAHFYHFPRSDWHRTIPPGTWAASRVPGPLVFHLKTQNWPTGFLVKMLRTYITTKKCDVYTHIQERISRSIKKMLPHRRTDCSNVSKARPKFHKNFLAPKKIWMLKSQATVPLRRISGSQVVRSANNTPPPSRNIVSHY